jgi:hypothetical protein
MLDEGRWTGLLIPSENPDQRVDVYYRVHYVEGNPTVLVGSSDFESRDARDIKVTADSLFLVFDGLEDNIPLHCALGRQSTGSYEGQCTDTSGGSTYTIMRPPDPNAPLEA